MGGNLRVSNASSLVGPKHSGKLWQTISPIPDVVDVVHVKGHPSTLKERLHPGA